MYRPNVIHPSHYRPNPLQMMVGMGPNPLQPGMTVMPIPTNTNFVGGPLHNQSQRVLKDSAFDKVVNTNRAMDPKMLEFKQFCTSLYGNHYLAQIVTEEKAFAFLFYHAYRVKKGKGQRLSTKDSLVQRFDRADYDKVMLATTNLGVSTEGGNEAEGIGDVLGWDMVNHYRCAIKRVLRYQKDNNANSLDKEALDSERIVRLLENVAKRKDRVAKANFKERMDGEFTPYKMIAEVTEIEDFMWNYHCQTPAFGAASLRDRYQFLGTLSGVLRSESLYRGDLSDLCDFKFKQRLEPDEYHIGIQRVSQGKANKEKVLYGRSIRHLNPELCSLGGLGLYLLNRFEVTNELEHMNFADNSTWFNRKLLKSMTSTGTCEGK